jgi:transcriptional regulator with XRE-family HTH domain
MDEKRIVENIKKVRLGRQMSLGQMAKRSGLTKGYLSKIENSHKAPPFSTLVKVAKALEVDIASLISEDEESKDPGDIKMCIVRANEGKGINPKINVHDFYYESLAYKKLGKSMEPFIVMPSFDKKPHPFTHDGEEFMHIFEGPFELVYGNETYILENGDSIYFDSSVPHYGRSIGKERAKVLVVLYSSKRP